ncbi:hypothetical protein FJZ31_31185 [Candidatus Poribacteria bacterium]|nr:hypothetical protein [Candidatus Poribacteria bacterium]
MGKYANGQGGKGARRQGGQEGKVVPCHLAILPSCLLFAYLLICILWAQAKTQLITTHISLNKNVEDYILITETGGITATVTIDFYNQKGDLVESIRKILPSHATIKMQVSKFLHETGIIMVNSDSDGIVGQHYYATQLERKRKDRVLISVPLQIRKAQSVSREIGTGQFCIPYADFISDPDDAGRRKAEGGRRKAEGGINPPSIDNQQSTSVNQQGAGVGSYIVVSDVSEDLRASGSIFEIHFYNREGEVISQVKSEIGKRATAIFNLNEYINSHRGIALDDYQEQEAKFGKVNLNITAGDVICEYAQFHPSTGVLIIPGIIYDSENKLSPEVPIVLYRFPLFSLQTPNGKMARWQDGKMASLPSGRIVPLPPGHLASLPFLEKLFITDIFGYGPAVNVEVLNNSSDILAQTKKLLPPHSTGMLELEDYTTDVVFDAIKIHCQSQIAAIYYFGPAIQQFPTSAFYSYAVSSAGTSEGESRHPPRAGAGGGASPHRGDKRGAEGGSKKLPTSFVIPWLSLRDDMEIHLFMTNIENEINEVQINFYHKDGSSFEEGQRGKGAREQTEGESRKVEVGRKRFNPSTFRFPTSAFLKPGIIQEWQPGILLPKDEQGSIQLSSSSANLAVLLLGVNANTGQIVMSVQAQIVP